MADEDSRSTDSSVSGYEGHSDLLRVAAEAGARLRTPAKMKMVRILDREQQRQFYWLIIEFYKINIVILILMRSIYSYVL